MLSQWAIKKLEHLTLDYMKLDCAEGSCYGVMAVSASFFFLPYLLVMYTNPVWFI
jgi:hypothetical protein